MPQNNRVNRLYTALGNRIKEKRESKGISQTDFSSYIGISRSSLVNIEKGRQRTPLHVIYSIAETLGISVLELMPRPVELESASDLSDDEIKQKANYQIQSDESFDKIKQFINRSTKGYE